MSVHIGELHTDVLPAGAPGPAEPGAGADPWALAERLAEDRHRVEWLARRVLADGFDD